jgi:hypothetical protein
MSLRALTRHLAALAKAATAHKKPALLRVFSTSCRPSAINQRWCSSESPVYAAAVGVQHIISRGLQQCFPFCQRFIINGTAFDKLPHRVPEVFTANSIGFAKRPYLVVAIVHALLLFGSVITLMTVLARMTAFVIGDHVPFFMT